MVVHVDIGASRFSRLNHQHEPLTNCYWYLKMLPMNGASEDDATMGWLEDVLVLFEVGQVAFLFFFVVPRFAGCSYHKVVC